MVTIKDGCGCDPCGCDWKQKLKEAYSRAIQSVNKIGDETGRVYFPDGTGFVKMPIPTKEQIDSIAEIDGIKASVDELNKAVPALETQVTGVTESLVSGVEVLNGTTAGKFKVRIKREKASLIDSNDYDLSKVNSIELIQGSGPAMVKAQLTLSNGTVLRSDDFLFTTESIGTDVYISSFTFKAGNVDGTISADIGLNNGVTIEANNFLVPTDPNIISEINDLNTRVSAIEGGSELNELKAAVANLQTNKADVDNGNQDITVNSIIGKSLYAKTDDTSGYAVIVNNVPNDENTPIRIISQIDTNGSPIGLTTGYVAMLDSTGKPKNFASGGEVWEELDLNNMPTDWVETDRVKVEFACGVESTELPNSWSSAPINTTVGTGYASSIKEFELKSVSKDSNTILHFDLSSKCVRILYVECRAYNYWNSHNYFNLCPYMFNGNGCLRGTNAAINSATLKSYINKIWRLKK